MTREIELPGRITSLPREYAEKIYAASSLPARTGSGLFSPASCSPETGKLGPAITLRDREMVHLMWSDVNFQLRTIRVTAKPKLGFYPKRWEEREIPIPAQLAGLLREHARRTGTEFIFPSPAGNREFNLLLRCKDVAPAGGTRSGGFRSGDII